LGRQKTELLNMCPFPIQKAKDLLLAYEVGGFRDDLCYADLKRRLDHYSQKEGDKCS